ncbi:MULTISPECIES: diaminopimelate dehydrogenase [Propionimicrobium]|uniref:Meso-diaminopimelate D-dehydrogenase n=1 Tax=Propionimicrobium lymphophilum ACS-093-V-SCH5 TaxID=883161 RepID=S2WJ53_9ACTN|nr:MULTISPECIES: diaminopimelate dehydrogenase [Propionimicrobium]EPD32667.1 diaminopimelate dehydrogenase [Propionimicrobium lymphophilum ACS-093-V-SCH5]ETJ98093.1 diaminopimelate dehydrogenase [Propionimicrobium sp. BV2F7]
MRKISAAIVGYGNLGKSAEKVIASSSDIDLYGIFSRRDSLDTGSPVFNVADVEKHSENIDVFYLCLGSATDIPEMSEKFARLACTVDTYDNHHYVAKHYEQMDEIAKASGNVSIVSTGWDPGMFSLNRVYASAVLPNSDQHTFWGPGVSQGHSDALRRIDGVQKAVQYTLPDEGALDKARQGNAQGLTGQQAHKRQCFVVADESEHARIEKEIREMPDYFVGYEVEINFISSEEFDRDHAGMPHGGYVITTGQANGTQDTIEYSLKLEKNADFTAAVAVAYGRAAVRMKEQGVSGAKTVLEVAPYLIHPAPLSELISKNV